jgi:hypothetical protein
VALCRILGSGNANLANIVAIFGQILAKGTDLVDGEVAKRMAVLLQQMHASLPPEVWGPCCYPFALLPSQKDGVFPCEELWQCSQGVIILGIVSGHQWDFQSLCKRNTIRLSVTRKHNDHNNNIDSNTYYYYYNVIIARFQNRNLENMFLIN